MPRFAIKKLPLNLSSMGNKIENPMSIRPELGEFEVEADSIDDARENAKGRVSPNEPNMICPWRDDVRNFTIGAKRERDFVHPTLLYKYNGSRFVEHTGKCQCDLPKSGLFMSKKDAKADYLAHQAVANKKLEAALEQIKSMKALGVSLDYHFSGDTHGINDEYMYLEVTEGAHQFMVKIKD
jgi:hypothetical protein